MTINSINVLENSNFVKEIKLILKQVVEFCLDNKTFELYLYEVNEFVVLKIVVINKDKMFKFNKDYNEHIIERRIVQIKNDNIDVYKRQISLLTIDSGTMYLYENNEKYIDWCINSIICILNNNEFPIGIGLSLIHI